MDNSVIDLEHWMTNLPSQLKSWPLIHLGIPGSHDSMTAAITKSSKLAPDAETLLQKLKFLGPLLRLVMSRWSKTQTYDVTEQLNCGIRYFDLRVATKRDKQYPYFVHGLYSQDVMSVLTSIRDFIDSHPHEVIILDFQHFYAFGNEDHNNLKTLLNTIFKFKLVPHTHDMKHITLEFMTQFNKYQAIVIYRTFYSQNDQPLLWPSYSFPTPWPQTVSKRQLFSKLNTGIANRQLSCGYISQCVLTPTNFFVLKNLFSTLKKCCVLPLHDMKIDWIRKQKIGYKGLNIVIGDFIDLNNGQFPMEIIKLNFKMFPTCASSLTPVEE